MLCIEQDNSEGFCGLVLWCLQLYLPGVEKENYSDVLKVCDPRCIRKMDRSYLG